MAEGKVYGESFDIKPYLSRRKFLQASALLAASAFLAACGKPNKETEPVVPVYTPIVGKTPEDHVRDFAFHEGEARRFLRENGIDSSVYGLMAAAGVSFLEMGKDGSGSYTKASSGGVVRWGEEIYAVTTQHAVEEYLTDRDRTKLAVKIPGVEKMHLIETREVSHFGNPPQEGYDMPIFFRLTGDLREKVVDLESQGRLILPQPVPLPEGESWSVVMMRFQRGEFGFHSFQFACTNSTEGTPPIQRMQGSSPVMCSGVSGVPGLLSDENGLPTSSFVGLFTHTVAIEDVQEHEADHHHVLDLPGENACSRVANLTTFNWFEQGLETTDLTRPRAQ